MQITVKQSTCAIMTLVCILLFYYLPNGQGLNNAFVALSGPHVGNHYNSIMGYSQQTYDGLPYHNENISILRDQLMASGALANTSFYAARPGGGLLAYLAPTNDLVTAPLLANGFLITLVFFATFVLCVRRQFTTPVSLLFGGLLVLLGCFGFMATSRSAHMPGAAMFALCLVYIVSLLDKDEILIGNLVFACAMIWFATATYYLNILLFPALLLTLLKRGRLQFIVLLFAVGCVAYMSLWDDVINAIYKTHAAFGNTESRALRIALEQMTVYLDESLAACIKQYFKGLASFLLAEPLSLLLLIVYATLLIKRRKQIRLRPHAFLILCVLGSFAAASPWVFGGWVRGYISYGIPISLLLGIIFAVKASPIQAKYLFIPLALAVTWQILWLYSYRLGNPVAPTTFFLSNYDALSIFKEYIYAFFNPPSYAYYNDGLQIIDYQQLAGLLGQADWTGYPDVTITGEKNWLRSLKICLYLFMPLFVLLCVPIYTKIIKYAPEKIFYKLILTGALSFALIFALIMAIYQAKTYTPTIFKTSRVNLSEEYDEVTYNAVLPKELISYAKEHGFIGYMVTTGTSRTSTPKKEIILKINEESPASYPDNERIFDIIPLYIQNGDVTFRIHEKYQAQVRRYMARPRLDNAIGYFYSDGSLPFLEFRFFGKDKQHPIFTYIPQYKVAWGN